MKLDKSDPLRRNAEEIRKAGERAASLTRQLLAFSRRQVVQPEVLDLNHVIADMEKMLHRLIGEDIDLVFVAGKDLERVKADPGQMHQVIMNLSVNSRDAMPHGGKLILETHNVELDEHFVQKYAAAKPGPYVMLAVTDSGSGMTAEVQSHLFEPFYTTKEVGKGTGFVSKHAPRDGKAEAESRGFLMAWEVESSFFFYPSVDHGMAQNFLPAAVREGGPGG